MYSAAPTPSSSLVLLAPRIDPVERLYGPLEFTNRLVLVQLFGELLGLGLNVSEQLSKSCLAATTTIGITAHVIKSHIPSYKPLHFRMMPSRSNTVAESVFPIDAGSYQTLAFDQSAVFGKTTAKPGTLRLDPCLRVSKLTGMPADD